MARTITEIVEGLRQSIAMRVGTVDLSEMSVMGSVLYAIATEIQRTEFIVDDFMSRYGLVAQTPLIGPTGPIGPVGTVGPTGNSGPTGVHGYVSLGVTGKRGISPPERFILAVDEPEKEPHPMVKLIAPWKINE
jgi:hypothetical protein